MNKNYIFIFLFLLMNFPMFTQYEIYTKKTTGISLTTDINGDGIAEVSVGLYDGSVYLLDGNTGIPIWKSFSGKPIFALTFLEDLGYVIAATGKKGEINISNVYALNISNENLVWTQSINKIAHWENYNGLAKVKDVNGDGFFDIAVGTEERVFMLSGKTGDVIWSNGEGAIQFVSAINDINGDGITDVVAAPGAPHGSGMAAYVLSGSNGEMIWSTSFSTKPMALDVFDLDGNGLEEVISASYNKIIILEGMNGSVLLDSAISVTPWQIVGSPDLNGDGMGDIVISNATFIDSHSGNVVAVSGKDGSVLWSTEWGPQPEPLLRLFTPSEVSFVAGTVGWSSLPTAAQIYRLYENGIKAWTYTVDDLRPDTISDIEELKAGQDINGNGIPEILATSYNGFAYMIDDTGNLIWKFSKPFGGPHTLIIAAGKGGTTDPVPGKYVYDHGAKITITAIPNTDYIFTVWSGDISGNKNPITITMNSDKWIKANFISKYTLTIAAGKGGTTDPVPGKYNYGYGTKVTIKATPDTGYIFAGWTGDVASEHKNDNPLTLTMESDKSIIANFKRIKRLKRKR